MGLVCSTRSLKNARFLQGPDVGFFPPVEPLEGFASVVSMHVLARLERSSQADLDVAGLARIISKKRPPAGGNRAVAPLFSGTLRFVQATFSSAGTDHAVPTPDLATAMHYATLSAPPLSAYASQYGRNSLQVAGSLLPFQTQVTGGTYNDQALAGWVDDLSKREGLGPDSCLVFLNPQGVVNVDANATQGVLGYHNISPAGNPYAFVNVMGQGLTVRDEKDVYALALSHEIAELTVDPAADGSNPEVSDGCAGNCNVDRRNYFDAQGTWLGGSPTPAYAFFTASVVKPSSAAKCPAPPSECTYPPPKVQSPPSKVSQG